MEISRNELENLKESAQRAMSRLQNIKQAASEQMRYVKQSIEIGVAAFGTSWALGRWGGPELAVSVVGVPVELLGFVLLHGAGYTGVLGSYGEDAHNLGDGMVAAWLCKKGLLMGSGKNTLTVSGYGAPQQLPAGNPGFSPMTEAERARAMAS